MQLTPEVITMIVTFVVTTIFGELAKKFNWDTKEHLPLQNVVIGLFSGIFIYALGFKENMIEAVLLGIFASMTAGGVYDLSKVKIIGYQKPEKEKPQLDAEQETEKEEEKEEESGGE